MKKRSFFPARFTLGVVSSVLMLAPSLKAAQEAGFTTSVKPYAVSISPEYVVKPLLSVGDRVPHTSDHTKQFQMIGVPDGLGAYKIRDQVVAYMNHEVAGTAVSEPVIGGPMRRGAF